MFQKFDGVGQNVATFLGFKIASNLIFVLSITILCIFLLKLKITTVKLNRALRQSIIQTELIRLKDVFKDV